MLKWIAGITLGTIGSLVGTIFYVFLKNSYNQSTIHATGLAVVKAQTLWSPVWWCGVFLIMGTAITFVQSPAWFVKGVLLGLAAFFVGFMLFNFVTGELRQNTAIGVGALFGMTIFNPFFWLALAGSIAIGISVVASWPVPVNR
jgi:hypothetical protein